MEDIKTWIEKVKKTERKPRSFLDNFFFHRDPGRPTFVEENAFFAPADGIILYQKVIEKMDEPVLDIKGNYFTLPELMGDEDFKEPSLVISIFMTSYDVHTIRMPTHGLLRSRMLDTIATRNLPMLETEKGLLKGILDRSIADFTRQNERLVNIIFSTNLNYKYYMVEVADSDVDVLINFSTEQNKWYSQGERCGIVRFGSMTSLVLPIDGRFEFYLHNPDMVHVEAAQDIIVDIKDKVRLI